MSKKYIQTVQDLIDLLNNIEDKTKPFSIEGIIGLDSNSRNIYSYFYNAEIWAPDITRNGYKLILS